MENQEKKKNNLGMIIVIIIVILLLLCACWFFLLKDKSSSGENTNTQENTKKKSSGEYNYTDGVLTQIVDEEGNPKQTVFVIDGLILVGNRHSYEGLELGNESAIEKLAAKGYKKTGINSSFYLNEYIEFYLDTAYEGSNKAIEIIVAPHRPVEEFEKMSLPELNEFAYENGGFALAYQKPDEENYKYLGEGYVNMDFPEGKYDILFTFEGKLAYFVEVTLTKEED